MSINKLWQLGLTRAMDRKRYKELANNVIYEAFGRGLNFIWFSFTLFWFLGCLGIRSAESSKPCPRSSGLAFGSRPGYSAPRS